jgi:hypothetical protein
LIAALRFFVSLFTMMFALRDSHTEFVHWECQTGCGPKMYHTFYDW